MVNRLLTGTSAAFPWYVRGVGCLEAGSAMCNLSFLFPAEAALAQAYLGCMTLSNACALYTMRHWVRATASRGGKALGAVVTVALAVGRQRVAVDAVERIDRGDEPRGDDVSGKN